MSEDELPPGLADFPHFLAAEEQNLIVSCLRLNGEFGLLSHLDAEFSKAISPIDVPEREQLAPALLLFVHFHLYISVASIARGHLSECFASTRKAIDATLSAYELIIDPSSVELYEKRDRRFLFIKNYIGKAREKDSTRYPLAADLLRLHEVYSEYGSHADLSSFVHRIEVRDAGEPGKGRFLFQYFQLPAELAECQLHFLGVLHAYYQMLVIFEPLLKRSSVGLPPDWLTELHRLGDAIWNRLNKARQQMAETDRNVAKET
jgi:hypothetical protein